MTKICKCCKSIFMTDKDEKMYCSKHCARRAYRIRKGGKVCKYCGSVFDPGDMPNREYCSKSHYRLGNGLGYDNYQMFKTETFLTERGTYEAV